MNLETMVQDALCEIKESGFVEKQIKKELENNIKETINDAFGKWSPLQKQLKEEINDKLQVSLESLSLSSYNEMILNSIQEMLDKQITTQGLDLIKESMEQLLNGETKSEYNVSDLVERLKCEIDKEDLDEYNNTMSCCILKDGNFVTIALDRDPHKSKYECKYKIHTYKGQISRIDINDKRIDNQKIMGGLYGFEALLFKMFARKSTIILDEDNINTEIELPDEYEEY